uniref:Cytosolic beta-glucosidase n=1 Tax=Cyprinodon variegatus TaxID=28743 RepID=A0A3Q2E5F6_CYPVA
MLHRGILKWAPLLALVLCVSAGGDFDWTKNEKTSFYYGTFPTDDINLMKEMKLNHYRFSVSWPRILPSGIREHINEKGIRYYNDLIDMLLDNKITPVVTLYHWDLPQVLQEKYGGWQNGSMVGYFNDYANLCFERFGNRVKHWITFNNPWSISVEGYETGEHAPGMKLRGSGAYKAAHNIIKQAHAKVWHTYDMKWRSKQKLIGISLTADWGEPVDVSNQRDIEAAERYIHFYLGWFATPLFHGDYPQVMKEYIRKSGQQGLGASRLPVFSPQEKSYIRGTVDFLGLGHYTTRYITQKNYPSSFGDSYFADRDLAELVDPQWPDPGSEWLYSVPWGFRRTLNFIKSQYGNPMIYVTENGVSEKMLCTDLCDEWRMQYFREYINEMLKPAVKDGVNVKGYTAWSLLDSFEWDEGFSERFGLYFVDFRNKNKPRYPKASVQFYKRLVSSNGFPNQREVESWKRKAVETCSSSNQLLAA